MLTGILLIALVSFAAALSYTRPKLIRKVIKNIPVADWINILIVPILLYFALMLIINSILIRVKVSILDFDDFFILVVGQIFLIYAFVGNSIHFVGKVLSRFIPENKHSVIYQINEVFHGKLSHYLAFVCTFLVLFTLSLLEINHPTIERLGNQYFLIVGFLGIIFGLLASKVVLYTNEWFGGYNKPLFFFAALLFLVLLILFRLNDLTYFYYPFNLFSHLTLAGFIGVFLFRQFMIFSRLSRRRRLRFLAKFLST